MRRVRALAALLLLGAGGLAHAQVAPTFDSSALQQTFADLTMGVGEDWVVAFPNTVVNVLMPFSSGLSARISGTQVTFTPVREGAPVQVTVVLSADVRQYLLVRLVPGRGLGPQVVEVRGAPGGAAATPPVVAPAPTVTLVPSLPPALSQPSPPQTALGRRYEPLGLKTPGLEGLTLSRGGSAAPETGLPVVIGDAPATLSVRLLRGASGLLLVAYEFLNTTPDSGAGGGDFAARL